MSDNFYRFPMWRKIIIDDYELLRDKTLEFNQITNVILINQ